MIKVLVIAMLLVACKGEEERPPRGPDGPPSSAELKLEAIKADLAAIDEKVATAITEVANAKDDAERQAAAARLESLQTDQRHLKERVEAVKAISQKCMENP